MARSRRRDSGSNRRQGGPRYRPSGTLPLPVSVVALPFSDAQDSLARSRGRLFTPPHYPLAKPVFARGKRGRSVGSLLRGIRYPARTVQLRVPAKVAFCVRRKQRREVLFSLRVAGRRGSAPGPYRRTPDSYYTC